MKRLAKAVWILVALVIIFAFCVALIPPLNAWFVGLLQGLLGGAAGTATGIWVSITSNPIYQAYHAIIWIVASLILFYAVHQAHAANKLPYFKVKPAETAQPTMKEPQAIIIREQPQTSGTQQPQQPTEQKTA